MSIEVMQFEGVTVTPKDDAVLYDLIFNTYGIFNGCNISFLGVNQLMVNSGRMIIKGRQVKITEETISVQLSPSGAKRGRLYIQLDFSKTENPGVFLSQVATTLPALTQEADANYNNGIFEVELCQYDVNETAISNIIMTCPTISSCMQVLDTLEEIEANTQSGMAAGALAVKEINQSLIELSLGINYTTDEVETNDVWIDGKPIYRKYISYTGALKNGYINIAELNEIGIDNIITIECWHIFYISNGGQEYRTLPHITSSENSVTVGIPFFQRSNGNDLLVINAGQYGNRFSNPEGFITYTKK